MEQYFDVNTVAEKLDLNPQTIYRWIRSGKLEAQKAGRNWRITEQNVEDALDDQPGNLAQRLARALDLEPDAAEQLQNYEAENGEKELRQLARGAIREKISGTMELELD